MEFDEAVVIVGASLTLVMVTVRVWLVALPTESVAVMVTTYVLLLPLSTGDSKSLAVIVKTPPADVIEKKDSSVPLFDHVTDSLAVKE